MDVFLFNLIIFGKKQIDKIQKKDKKKKHGNIIVVFFFLKIDFILIKELNLL